MSDLSRFLNRDLSEGEGPKVYLVVQSASGGIRAYADHRLATRECLKSNRHATDMWHNDHFWVETHTVQGRAAKQEASDE